VVVFSAALSWKIGFGVKRDEFAVCCKLLLLAVWPMRRVKKKQFGSTKIKESLYESEP
jgi:hypothetical protein